MALKIDSGLLIRFNPNLPIIFTRSMAQLSNDVCCMMKLAFMLLGPWIVFSLATYFEI